MFIQLRHLFQPNNFSLNNVAFFLQFFHQACDIINRKICYYHSTHQETVTGEMSWVDLLQIKFTGPINILLLLAYLWTSLVMCFNQNLEFQQDMTIAKAIHTLLELRIIIYVPCELFCVFLQRDYII